MLRAGAAARPARKVETKIGQAENRDQPYSDRIGGKYGTGKQGDADAAAGGAGGLGVLAGNRAPLQGGAVCKKDPERPSVFDLPRPKAGGADGLRLTLG